MDALLEGKVRLLRDEHLGMIRAYQMEMPGGAIANMGWVVVDRNGNIKRRQVDAAFGTHLDLMISEVRR